jgi:hypothetical protein
MQEGAGITTPSQQPVQRPQLLIPVRGSASRRSMCPHVLDRRRQQTQLTRALHHTLNTTLEPPNPTAAAAADSTLNSTRATAVQ